MTRRTTFRFNVTENREPRTESSRVVPSSSFIHHRFIVRARRRRHASSRDPRAFSRERDCADDDRRRGIRVDVSPRARVHRTLLATLRAVDRVNCRVSMRRVGCGVGCGIAAGIVVVRGSRGRRRWTVFVPFRRRRALAARSRRANERVGRDQGGGRVAVGGGGGTQRATGRD